MKKNFFKSLVLVFGLVACLGGASFASNNISHHKPQLQSSVNCDCEFKGLYRLNNDELQKLQKDVNGAIRSVLNNMNDDLVDLDVKIEKVDLRINRDGQGKLSLLVNIKADSKAGLNIYNKTYFAFDISQKDANTFTLDFVTKNCTQDQDCSDLDLRVSKTSIDGKTYLVAMDSSSNTSLFEKIK